MQLNYKKLDAWSANNKNTSSSHSPILSHI